MGLGHPVSTSQMFLSIFSSNFFLCVCVAFSRYLSLLRTQPPPHTHTHTLSSLWSSSPVLSLCLSFALFLDLSPLVFLFPFLISFFCFPLFLLLLLYLIFLPLIVLVSTSFLFPSAFYFHEHLPQRRKKRGRSGCLSLFSRQMPMKMDSKGKREKDNE